MLQNNITNFLNECKHYQFSKSTIQAFTTRLNELGQFFENNHIQSFVRNHLSPSLGDGPHSLSIDQVKVFFEFIDRTPCLGIRDYVVYGLMYGLGLRVGEVHAINMGKPGS